MKDRRGVEVVKVLQIGMTSNIGGMETYIMSQYRHLDKSRIQYDFLNITGEKDIVFSDEILSCGSVIYSVSSRHNNPLKHYFEIIRLLWKIRREYKVIVLNTCHLYYMFPIFIAMLFQYPKRIVHSHNSGDELQITFKRKILISLNKLLMNLSATDYWACSRMAGQWMFGNYIHFDVIHNAIDVDKFYYRPSIRTEMREKLGIPSQAYVIGNVARFSYQKNQEYLIDIFNEVHRLDDSAYLVLVGTNSGCGDYENRVRKRVSDYHLDENVIFLGMRDDADKIYQAMDCFVLTSIFEGLCISAIEAQTACLPCVCSDVLPEEAIITDRLYSKKLSDLPREWAEFILKLKRKERYDIRKEISKSGYDISKEVKKLENMFING